MIKINKPIPFGGVIALLLVIGGGYGLLRYWAWMHDDEDRQRDAMGIPSMRETDAEEQYKAGQRAHEWKPGHIPSDPWRRR